MDSLKSLMDKKEYELVIKLTNNSLEVYDLFYRVSAFLALFRLQEALEVIDNNRRIMEHDLPALIKIHIELLCLAGEFNEARKELNYYSNLPYHSQQVEEILRDMPEFILKEEKMNNSLHALNDQEILAKLTSKNAQEVIIGLDNLRIRDVIPFLKYISNILVNFPVQSVRSFALLLLVQKEVDRDLSFNSLDKIIKINPKHLLPPFDEKHFNQRIKRIEQKFNDPSLSQTAVQIYSSYLLYIYPSNPIDDEDLLFAALYAISLSYLGRNNELEIDKFCFEQGLDKNKLTELIKQINDSMETI